MVDALYVRGWDDCLEAISLIISQSRNIGEIQRKIEQLHELIRQNKFEKIKHELGVFGLF